MEFNKNNIPLHTDNKKEHNNVSFERNKKDKEQEKLKEERIRYEKERLKLEKMISRRIEKADKKENLRCAACSPQVWPARRDLNPRPSESESAALSSWATGGYY